MDEKEQKVEDKEEASNEHHRHNIAIAVVLIVIAILILAGGCFFLGRISSRAKIGRIDFARDVAIERPTMPQMIGGRGGQFRDSGISGKITAISGDNLIIHSDSANKDYTVVISNNTSIRNSREIASKSDLKNNQTIRVSGTSNSSGQILARLIVIQ